MRTLPIPPILIALAASLAAQGPPPAAVRTDTARKETVREVVTGVATVEPWLRTVLGSEIEGLVTRYPLREGDAVEAGKTVVCELERTSLLIDLAEARALLARAEAEAETAVETARDTMEENRVLQERADRDLVRAKELFAKAVVNQAELDRAEADALAARFRFRRAEKAYRLAKEGTDPASKAREADVRRAKARLDRVEDRLSKTRIVSPVDGRVARRMTEVGGWVDRGSGVIEIIALDPVLVRIHVNERDIGKVGPGCTASVRVNAHPGRIFAGRVRHLVPEANRRSRAFPVLIEVPNPEGRLLAGMFARVEIVSNRTREALTVPKDALVRGPRGTVVFTIAGGKAVPVPVRPGKEVGGRVVVEGEGIEEGLTVITAGNEKLRPGQAVRPE